MWCLTLALPCFQSPRPSFAQSQSQGQMHLVCLPLDLRFVVGTQISVNFFVLPSTHSQQGLEVGGWCRRLKPLGTPLCHLSILFVVDTNLTPRDFHWDHASRTNTCLVLPFLNLSRSLKRLCQSNAHSWNIPFRLIDTLLLRIVSILPLHQRQQSLRSQTSTPCRFPQPNHHQRPIHNLLQLWSLSIRALGAS